MADERRTVSEVDALDLDAFVAIFGGVYESTPSLAAAAAALRPYGDLDGMLAAFVAVADELDADAVLALLRAHPVLAAAAPMTAESTDEQRSAGLTDLDADTRARLREGNAEYLERFGFPFIIAVRGRSLVEIEVALRGRLANGRDAELAEALQQVQRIAALRIGALVAP